jgi:multiple sugar transport system permease protein
VTRLKPSETDARPSDRGASSAESRKWRQRIRILGQPFGFQHLALLPLIVFLLLFVLYPVFQLIRMGFSTLTVSGGEFRWNFSGLDNFYTALGDEIFRAALINTLVFVAATVIIQLILGTALAILVERARYLSGIARNVLVWPAIITPVAVSVVWWLILNIEFGALNYILEAVGLSGQAWLASTTWALPTLIAVDVWHWTPIVFLLVLAGLANIDQTLYEAARIDGASAWDLFRHVTLPLLLPVLGVAALARTILGFKVFDEIFLLTSGGPGTSTEVISTYIRRVFFDQLNMGYGAFLGLVVVAVLLMLFATFISITRRGRES